MIERLRKVGYFALVHRPKAGVAAGKELLVGVLFAAGVAVPLLASGVRPAAWLPAVAGFGCACWLNCRLIDRWEEGTAGAGVGEALIAVAAIGLVAAIRGLGVPARFGRGCGWSGRAG